MIGRVFVIAAVMAVGILSAAQAHSSKRCDLPLIDSVSIDGITWKFPQKATVGRFVNGDYYVVGAVTTNSVSPARNATDRF